jgi:hypothetical protein
MLASEEEAFRAFFDDDEALTCIPRHRRAFLATEPSKKRKRTIFC